MDTFLEVESGFKVRFAVVSHNAHESAEPEHSLQLELHEDYLLVVQLKRLELH